jgi:hypothetical protein
VGGCDVDSYILQYGHIAGCCEHGNKYSGSNKCGKFFLLAEELSISEEHCSFALLRVILASNFFDSSNRISKFHLDDKRLSPVTALLRSRIDL